MANKGKPKMEKINAEELKKIANVQTLTDEELETVAGGVSAAYMKCIENARDNYNACVERYGNSSAGLMNNCMQEKVAAANACEQYR